MGRSRVLALYKRFENGKMSWLHNSDEVKALTSRQVGWLMKGFSIDPKIKNLKTVSVLQILRRLLDTFNYMTFTIERTAFGYSDTLSTGFLEKEPEY
ncbi:IS66 family insertion sequence element accessory protein TnpB [Lactobacillus helveticus]|uniref:IS66 family insertion sequence element accessory protein TnpB n=1 Tax=Lactobacillus helveticus TaxID=1587 RepID=UPI001EE64101|nr:IS66 family insertion sequence element accessory protein TnpB [Lactobacillus helveticus]